MSFRILCFAVAITSLCSETEAFIGSSAPRLFRIRGFECRASSAPQEPDSTFAQPRVVDRKLFLKQSAVLASGLLCPSVTLAASDAEGQGEEVAEGVRKLAANIPGLGPSDVGYPLDFQGKWTAQKVLAGIETPAGEEAAEADELAKAKARLGKSNEFPIRFLKYGDRVIADREFNTKQLVQSEDGKEASVQWKMSNPNLLSISYGSGEMVERKVTKRSASMDQKAGTVEFSEYTRIAELGSGGSLMARGTVPEIKARWLRGRYKIVSPQRVEGILIEYFLPSSKPEPSAATLKLKYRLRLDKLVE